MNETHTESVEFDVNLPKPKSRGLILKIVAGLVILGVVAFAVFAIVSRTATSTTDATAQVMPATTQLFFSMTTHPDKQANFDVIANAWKDSKEAKQIDAALSLALTGAGLSWENDVVPWLGERAAFGLIDLGGYEQPTEPSTPSKPQFPKYRTPFFLVAVQTKDKAKSDAFLASLRKQMDSSARPSGYFTQTIGDDNYRGVPIVYMTVEYGGSMGSTNEKNETIAYATVNDMIVLTTNRDQLKQAIDAALNGANLAASETFKTTMAALPGQNVAAMYMDINRFMTGYMSYMNAILSLSMSSARQPNQQMQMVSELMQAYGGVGMAMTYEPSGIRFDLAEQFDPGRLPEKWRSLFGAGLTTPTNNKVFDSVPASAQIVLNGSTAMLKGVLDPDYLSMAFANNPAFQNADIAGKLAQFQQLTGVNLKTDLLDLVNGEYAFAMSIQDPSKGTGPIDAALLLDSNDATRMSASLDKIFQGIAALSNGSIKWQNLSGLPYSVLADNRGNPMFTYGVVDSRLVIGTNSDTLLSIDNADKTPLSADATFKDALNGLPTNRIQTFYFNMKPLWDLLKPISGQSGMSGVLNYMRPFKYISIGSEVPNGNLTRGVMRIAIEAAK